MASLFKNCFYLAHKFCCTFHLSVQFAARRKRMQSAALRISYSAYVNNFIKSFQIFLQSHQYSSALFSILSAVYYYMRRFYQLFTNFCLILNNFYPIITPSSTFISPALLFYRSLETRNLKTPVVSRHPPFVTFCSRNTHIWCIKTQNALKSIAHEQSQNTLYNLAKPFAQL